MTRKKGIKSMADDAFTKLVNETPAARKKASHVADYAKLIREMPFRSENQKTAIAKVDAREATFFEWFTAQYGERPSLSGIDILRDKLSDALAAADDYRNELEETAVWENARDAALKAWQASKDQK